MNLITVLSLLCLGCFSGFMAGLLGVGGGMIIVPFLTLLFTMQQLVVPEYVVHSAIATAMATIIFTSMSSMRAHHKRGGVIWSIVAQFTPGIILGGFLSGTVIFRWLDMAWLSLVFAVFVLYSSYNMMSNKKPKPSRQLPGWFGMVCVGVGIGLVSGLVGAGGGFLSVPFMVWSNVPLKKAVSTSAAIGFPIAVANSIAYIVGGWNLLGMRDGMIGYLYWPALLVLIAMSMIFAPIGAKYAHTLPVDKLKKIFACLLFFIALMMLRQSLQEFGFHLPI
ncbi:sulfite exporter TauE/SafE family protein [Pelistega europaea]|uniref:Probable membrane transporter protein n=1 Tax=Pelistega europaea TaxID=106147 RepID=A0A7Y4LA50_9BURK|nr:sulfite exporter TauE/SafE family protein [Pelistega europaea]NOL48652.1 sulfite exporter TauE/SafE family protein [Pelistega europaea]